MRASHRATYVSLALISGRGFALSASRPAMSASSVARESDAPHREFLSIAATLTLERRIQNLEEVVAAQATKLRELDHRVAP